MRKIGQLLKSKAKNPKSQIQNQLSQINDMNPTTVTTVTTKSPNTKSETKRKNPKLKKSKKKLLLSFCDTLTFRQAYPTFRRGCPSKNSNNSDQISKSQIQNQEKKSQIEKNTQKKKLLLLLCDTLTFRQAYPTFRHGRRFKNSNNSDQISKSQIQNQEKKSKIEKIKKSCYCCYATRSPFGKHTPPFGAAAPLRTVTTVAKSPNPKSKTKRKIPKSKKTQKKSCYCCYATRSPFGEHTPPFGTVAALTTVTTVTKSPNPKSKTQDSTSKIQRVTKIKNSSTPLLTHRSEGASVREFMVGPHFP